MGGGGEGGEEMAQVTNGEVMNNLFSNKNNFVPLSLTSLELI